MIAALSGWSGAAGAAPAAPWQTLPPTPAPVAGLQTARATLNGACLWYATVGHGPPVVLLHGGLANSDWWGRQVAVLQADHRVILLDSRGQGRSEPGHRPFTYALLTDDVIALLDRLSVDRAAVVGWSDGAIVALDLARRYPERVSRVVAFAANVRPAGMHPAPATSAAFATYRVRTAVEYRRLSPKPAGYAAVLADLRQMWAHQPDWPDATLRAIRTPVLVMDGDHDEIIWAAHTRAIAASIPGARLVMLPDAGHFAFLQSPAAFNAAMRGFLDGD